MGPRGPLKPFRSSGSRSQLQNKWMHFQGFPKILKIELKWKGAPQCAPQPRMYLQKALLPAVTRISESDGSNVCLLHPWRFVFPQAASQPCSCPTLPTLHPLPASKPISKWQIRKTQTKPMSTSRSLGANRQFLRFLGHVKHLWMQRR